MKLYLIEDPSDPGEPSIYTDESFLEDVEYQGRKVQVINVTRKATHKITHPEPSKLVKL